MALMWKYAGYCWCTLCVSLSQKCKLDWKHRSNNNLIQPLLPTATEWKISHQLYTACKKKHGDVHNNMHSIEHLSRLFFLLWVFSNAKWVFSNAQNYTAEPYTYTPQFCRVLTDKWYKLLSVCLYSNAPSNSLYLLLTFKIHFSHFTSKFNWKVVGAALKERKKIQSMWQDDRLPVSLPDTEIRAF